MMYGNVKNWLLVIIVSETIMLALLCSRLERLLSNTPVNRNCCNVIGCDEKAVVEILTAQSKAHRLCFDCFDHYISVDSKSLLVAKTIDD